MTSILGRKKQEYQDLAAWSVFAPMMHRHVLFGNAALSVPHVDCQMRKLGPK